MFFMRHSTEVIASCVATVSSHIEYHALHPLISSRCVHPLSTFTIISRSASCCA